MVDWEQTVSLTKLPMAVPKEADGSTAVSATIRAQVSERLEVAVLSIVLTTQKANISSLEDNYAGASVQASSGHTFELRFHLSADGTWEDWSSKGHYLWPPSTQACFHSGGFNEVNFSFKLCFPLRSRTRSRPHPNAHTKIFTPHTCHNSASDEARPWLS